MNEKIIESINWGNKQLTIETGEIAKQANGAVLVKYGNTVVLCTCVIAEEPVENADFFPLTINYIEKFYAAGRLPGGFVKREGKPADHEILTARLIDRPIRPLFADGFYNEVQVVCTLLSYDPECRPDIASMIGASAAISISGAPFNGPIAGCRVGYENNEYILNPSAKSQMELVVAGSKDGILMVESEINELPEDVVLGAVMYGFKSFQPVIDMINNLKHKCYQHKCSQYKCSQHKCSKPKCSKRSSCKQECYEHECCEHKYCEKYNVIPPEVAYAELDNKIRELSSQKLSEIFGISSKQERAQAIELVRKSTLQVLSEQTLSEQISSEQTSNDTPNTSIVNTCIFNTYIINTLFYKNLSRVMRSKMLETRKRMDGRKLDQIRNITCKIDILPKNVHGSALFTRGETQALVTTTLGSSIDAQVVDGVEGSEKDNFLLHYNFLPFSVGEVGRIGAPGRREIGHGKLAWRALNSMMPENFPYTVRVVSEITESNGSSSMATVCGTTLSLMAAGVPIKSPVAGIAMGLIKTEDDFLILSDIMGDEDHLGDMDFKVAGTENGITALQMDIKIDSISEKILKAALKQAKKGRLHILKIMKETIDQPRAEVSEYAPRIQNIQIDKDKIRDLIGPGGKTIKDLCDRLLLKIDIAEDGNVTICAPNQQLMNCGISEINMICVGPVIGQVVTGTVNKITDFGAFVSIGPKEGLLHISRISKEKISKVSDVLHIGQEVTVKIISIDDKNRINLSMKDIVSRD